ncbi:tetratricopeptide repeat protein [Persicimonas caeni]|uniref:Tetratricopeptide repeat protein n=1 Tax=Persicimonas caeni TaxID=2292766 RepID=A0A4Y6PN61_PERCE|nr:tetratricopeptide repeat protein [Persicimonas caeni]QDG49457.1 tetratricopeptide repeat protein [Persicimonas caeni]QED30678.1 tetratricopeptide repeat protein [Persicimonas caeni]
MSENVEKLEGVISAAKLPEEGSRQALPSLKIAALLGPMVRTREWEAACRLAGFDASDRLVDALVSHGLAERVADGWRFVDRELVDALVDKVRGTPAWKKYHTMCANALFSVAGDSSAGVARRRADHLLAAGSSEEALEPLLMVEKEAYADGAYEQAHAVLDERQRLMDELELPSDDPRRAQNDWRSARLLQIQGQRRRALRLLDGSRQVLERTDWASERGNAALIHGQMLRDEGRLEEARESFEDATAQYALAADDSGLASSRMHRGHLEMEQGNLREALEFFEASLRSFEQIGDAFMMAVVLSQMSYAWLMQGDHAEAESCAARARDISQEAGHKTTEAAALNSLGEIARDRQDWDDARRFFEQAIILWLPAYDRNLHIARFNLALVEIGVGNYTAAKRLFLDVAERFAEMGFGPREPLVHAGLMTCSAAEEDWEAFEHHQARVLETVEKLGLGDDDLIWMVHKASVLVGERGTPAAKAAARELLMKLR